MDASNRDSILEQLSLILNSPRFSGSTVLSEFLAFIVHETLEKRGHVLKEYTIGVHALGKDVDFNPQLDSIVRIHAGRLRRALKEYYYEDGVNDSIVIAIPKGSYMPSFETRSTTAHDPDIKRTEPERREPTSEISALTVSSSKNEQLKKRHDHKPSIAVLPYRKIGQGDFLEPFSQSLGEFLCTELTRFENLKVISYYSSGHLLSHDRQLKELGFLLDADYILTGTVEEAGEHFRVFVQFNCCETGEQLWGRTFENSDSHSHWDFQNNIVEIILAAVTGINGLIARDEIKRRVAAPGASDTTSLAFWYNKYSHSPDHKTLQEAKHYYQQVLKEDPNNALAMAYLSCILNTESCLEGLTVGNESHSFNYASTALRLDPHCQQAYQAMAFNMLIQRKSEACVRTLEEGLLVNPKSAEYRGAMGAFLIYSGNFERGIEMLDHVIKLIPALPWWQMMAYSCYGFYRGNYNDVLFWADRVTVNFIWLPVLKAASYAELNQCERVIETLKQFNDAFPDISLSDRGVLNKVFFTDKLVQRLEGGIMKALAHVG